ncbi:MAG: hypothetical protein Q9224_007071, partial [Gallowayella concinna]
MSNTEGVHANINWNEAAALEFLGAPGINQPTQSQIQAVFANIATVIYSYVEPVEHHIHVRCDDPEKRCSSPADDDPCNPNPKRITLTNRSPPATPGVPKLGASFAYANNDGGDGYAMINFCDGFLRQRSLTNAIAYGTGLPVPTKFSLGNFDNRAVTFFHELTHLDLAANSPAPNPRVSDLMIQVTDDLGRT